MTKSEIHNASFRDPDGFIFQRDGMILRQINPSYADEYEHLMGSGLYETLVKLGLLIPHSESAQSGSGAGSAYKVIEPERVPILSYAYEWSFSQLKAAALASLKIMETALAHKMMLKDCNSFNIQFYKGRPVLIDSLSFMFYQEGMLWPAYRQFCQHFLMPLALMSYCDPRLGVLLARYVDGIPLDLGCELLPFKARFSPGLLVHLFIHAGVDKRTRTAQRTRIPSQPANASLMPLVDNLRRTVDKINPPSHQTAWGKYESLCLYSEADQLKKKQFVMECLETVHPATVWDLGANVGTYSWMAAATGASVVAIDNDHAAIDDLSQAVFRRQEPNILPLVADILNPTPRVGWENAERSGLLDRGPADLVLALALLHHIVVGANVPLKNAVRLLAGLGKHVITEFVPKNDPQVELLLAHRKDIFPDYHQQGFEAAFGEYFRLVRTESLDESPRILYHLERSIAT